ncbi:MAG: hypothetical protein BWZ09_02722 [Alphaproteobacteria bacterium ADurb.BinA305]|jgi:hypothetical protein|nr:MAG: hypothetical protein BWZ09_02722 [Alphaproteobacteria bacterium ADurb.BinA305]
MESKHGGSPASGLVQPAGIDRMNEKTAGGILIPQTEEMRKSSEAKMRALQFERRRLALSVLEGLSATGGLDDAAGDVKLALKYADELMMMTGGVV